MHERIEPMFNMRCRECHQPMWTWTEREDTCEQCMFEFRQRRQEMYKQRNAPNTSPFTRTNERQVKVGLDAPKQRQVNPFAPQPESRKKIDPFGSGGSRGPLPNPFR